jgi:hypothetical protein
MAVALYMDVHVPRSITDQLRRRGIDVLTAIEDHAAEFPDDAILQRAYELDRVVFTQDIRFKLLAEQWQRHGQPFAGLLFGHQLHGTIGQYVRDLDLIAQASEPREWQNAVGYLPF